MLSKNIVFTSAFVTELISEEVKQLGPNDVLVRLAVSTISTGTERANLVGEVNISVLSNLTHAHFPRRVGYSSAGTVVAVGSSVTSVAVGDRVAVSWSTHSQFCVVKECNVYKLLDDISFEEAATWHISTFPMAAIRKCRLEIGESALVMGVGLLGMMAIKILKASGACPLIAVDPDENKRKIAKKIGADYVFDPNEFGFAEKVKEVTCGGVNVAIEVTGNGKALDSLLDCMAKLGRVALLGCTRSSDFTIDYYKKVHGPGIVLIGAHTNARQSFESAPTLWTTRDDVIAVQKLVVHNRLKFADIVNEIHPVEDYVNVFNRLGTEKSFPVVQLDWRNLK